MYEVLSHILNAFSPQIFLIFNYVYVGLGRDNVYISTCALGARSTGPS